MSTMLYLYVSEEGAEPERLSLLARYLRDDLLQLDVDDVAPVAAGEAPPGTRGLDLSTAGELVVTVGQLASALQSIIFTVQRWLGRSQEGTAGVRLEVGGAVLELSNVSAADRDRLVNVFINQVIDDGGQRWTVNDRH
ncbi:hypothetical protein [Streptomyces sp. KR80]|uniref:hypothetical protein n=1 Tax=Streptomyces sp. KR80 TaxID=3457426 RepID=UPI003FD0860B